MAMKHHAVCINGLHMTGSPCPPSSFSTTTSTTTRTSSSGNLPSRVRYFLLLWYDKAFLDFEEVLHKYNQLSLNCKSCLLKVFLIVKKILILESFNLFLLGANRNTELKVWSCATWTCLQTINFSTSSPSTTELKAALDLSAKYLLLSDIHRKIVYVLRLEDVSLNSILTGFFRKWFPTWNNPKVNRLNILSFCKLNVLQNDVVPTSCYFLRHLHITNSKESYMCLDINCKCNHQTSNVLSVS